MKFQTPAIMRSSYKCLVRKARHLEKNKGQNSTRFLNSNPRTKQTMGKVPILLKGNISSSNSTTILQGGTKDRELSLPIHEGGMARLECHHFATPPE